jgi:osmotically-inducible protein OsmY
MITKSRTLEVVAAAVLLPGAMTIPAVAAEPAVSSNAASDAAPPVLPGDASTPTAAAHDVDDAKVTSQIKIALAADSSLSAQAHEVSVSTNPQAVTLRGSVMPGEKERIESVAGQFAGTRQVVDQLLVRDM